jgi:hypothetical protein
MVDLALSDWLRRIVLNCGYSSNREVIIVNEFQKT